MDDAPVRIVDLPDSEPGAAEPAMDVAAWGVYRTDLESVEGDLAARRLPIIPDHRAVGRVGRSVPTSSTGNGLVMPD